MSIARIKTLVIAALALFNVFFLVVVLLAHIAAGRERALAESNVRAILAAAGIEVRCEIRLADERPAY
ncbi:MAG: hypothetical protein LBT36_03205, partial [Oscillospiraceae bacterium]|nr:hypothetical protein [Oscillospiraceae bacterium]